VDAEHDPTAGDAGRDPRRRTSEQRTRAWRAPPRQHERKAGKERCRRGGVTARERRPERLRDRVERRADTVEEVLDGVDEHDLADDHGDEEGEDPAVRRPHGLDDADGDDQRDRGRRGREVRDELEPVGRPVGGVVGSPLADAAVDVDEPRARPHQVRERADDEAADDGHAKRDCEREPGGGGGVEPATEDPRDRRVPDGGADEPLGGRLARIGGGLARRGRKARGGEIDGQRDEQGDGDEHEQGHRMPLVYPTPVAG